MVLQPDHPSSAADRDWVASQVAPLTAVEVLSVAFERFGSQAAIATSFGPEDIVLLHLAAQQLGGSSLQVFTLDTGRLPVETFEVMQAVVERFGLSLQTLVPNHLAVEDLVRRKGFFSFRESLEARKECCSLRKVEPLSRALSGRRAWITGMRREQSVTRDELPTVQWDAQNGLVKFNPLATWTRAEVWAVIEEERLPYNRLHDVGYPSIGCAPCTRAVRPHEDERAGRWWWESAAHRECGLHRR